MDTTGIEVKSADEAGVNLAFDTFMRGFEVYKEENEERLKQLEKRGAADPLTTDKLARLDRMFDDLAHKTARPQLAGGVETREARNPQIKAAFEGYVRRGDAARLVALEGKALSAGSASDGGYLVPPETEAAVNRALMSISPIRAIASVRQVSSNVYKKPFTVTGADNGWVGETAIRSQTNAPTLASLTFQTMELFAMPAATQTLLDDSIVNIDQWIADEVRLVFAQQEGRAFVNGDGVNKPKGFMAYATVDNATWSFGNLGTVSTGVAGAFPAATAADKLIDLVYALRAGYRGNARFVMNRATEAAVRKMKDGAGRYVWEPSTTPGEPATLMGFPVIESEDMPDMSPGSNAIAFGDFQRGYLIVDRTGISVLRDPYSAKPYVLFYTTKRVGGGVQDFDAIKLLRFAV